MNIKKLNEKLSKLLENFTADAVDIAFPEKDQAIKHIITTWYENEGIEEDFEDPEEMADFIKDDIYDMIDAADATEEADEVRKAFEIEDEN